MIIKDPEFIKDPEYPNLPKRIWIMEKSPKRFALIALFGFLGAIVFIVVSYQLGGVPLDSNIGSLFLLAGIIDAIFLLLYLVIWLFVYFVIWDTYMEHIKKKYHLNPLHPLYFIRRKKYRLH